jgi:1-acyl-sn-glycerol-3-phosphate acyltransferase
MPSYPVYRIVRFTCFVVLKSCFRLRIIGRENIPKSGGFIVASNHVSHFDPAVVGAAVPQTVHFLAREDLYTARFWGHIIKRVATIPVKREYKDFKAMKMALKVLKKGDPVGIFPEGTRSTDHQLGEAQLGIGMLAAHSGARVVPMLVKGTERILPKHARMVRFERVEIRIGKPFTFAEYAYHTNKKESYRFFSNSVMERIARLKTNE